MKDVAKVNWFKAKLIVYMAGYLAKKSIDDSTIRSVIYAISEFFKDKDEKQVLRAIHLLCAKVRTGIDTRFKELEGEIKGEDKPLDREEDKAEWRRQGKHSWTQRNSKLLRR